MVCSNGSRDVTHCRRGGSEASIGGSRIKTFKRNACCGNNSCEGDERDESGADRSSRSSRSSKCEDKKDHAGSRTEP